MVEGNFTFLVVDGTGRPSDPESRAAIRIYPLDTNLNVHKWMTDDFQFLYQNKTLLSAVYLATYAVDDLRCSTRLSSWTQQLLCNILSSLNRDLHEAVGQQSSTTMITILILLFPAELLQDFGALRSHLEGVGRLLLIKDNVTGLDAKLLYKIQQFDLRLALASGRPLHLTLEGNGYPTLPMPPIVTPDILQKLKVHSPRVIEAFQNLQGLTQDIKYALIARNDLMWTDSQSQINNIQTQLLHPNNNYADIDEALKLGMLAFLTTLSRSPVRRPQLPDLQRRFETSYTAIQDQNMSHKTFTIWVMMMGFFSAIEVSNPVVGDLWGGVVDSNLLWETARDMILAEDLPWIEFIHDGPAKEAFVYLQAHRTLE
ncbi:hypothetical protein FPOAC1_010072 [Fusarium poae]|uniref:hypothetical protein n=1 Tax=Fusarium poae TaxID=36050 RepID=UPI001CEA80EE|nr:hypothetical protein FPOAC1_010072 [Fusarium poae]KAG8670640.1 hypothetical protein FPOAC1_010072 [Fusarium poae]